MAKNSFTDFKNRYAGKDTVADEISDTIAEQMEALYRNTYNAIYRILGEAKKDVNYPTYAKQTQILKQIGEELDTYRAKATGYYTRALKKIAEYGSRVAIKDLEILGSKVTKAKDWHYDYNVKYVEQVFKDNFTHIAGQTTRIKNSVKTALQAESAKVFRLAAVAGITRKEAYKRLRAEISDKMPEFQFIDRAGRRWDSKTYFEMLTHTVMSTTLNECYVNSLTSEGHDLVRIPRNGAKDACRKWEEKVLSLTGATEGYPTLDEARATGQIFHPRCKHRLVAYHESIESVFEAVKSGKSDKEILES